MLAEISASKRQHHRSSGDRDNGGRRDVGVRCPKSARVPSWVSVALTRDNHDVSPAPTRTWLPLAAVATTLVLWASAFVGIRHLGESVPPGALSLSRLLVMAIALLALMKGRLPRLPTRREWPLIVAGGASWFGVYNLALNESERRIDAGHRRADRPDRPDPGRPARDRSSSASG